MYLLENPRRNYAWGSPTLIQQLMGLEVDGQPLAEVWMGAHPDDPSVATTAGRVERLDQLISRCSTEMLGEQVASRFDGRLPYLVKFLAAAKGLSIQVHPSATQARAGFERENSLGIALTDPLRTYRDATHKPELLFALTPMELLSGLREPEQAAKLLESLDIAGLDGLIDKLRSSSDSEVAMHSAFEWLLAQPEQTPWVGQVRERTSALREGLPELQAVYRLCEQYPADAGVIAPLLMNYAQIKPGQVIFTGARTLHAYLRGMALEVMGASDNVIRAALTPKHVDKAAVLEITDFSPQLVKYVAGASNAPGSRDYCIDGIEDFGLRIVKVHAGEQVQGPEHGPRLAVCLQGSIELETTDLLQLSCGQSAFSPDAEGPLTVSGNGTAAVVFVP